MSRSATERPVRLLVVIALYKLLPTESKALSSLQDSCQQLSSDDLELKILLYDNTPHRFSYSVPNGILYEAPGENLGLTGAYNRALEVAKSEGFSWLLTMDQDTTLPLNFLARMCELVPKISGDNQVAAIVPQLSDGPRLLSPVSIGAFGVRYLPRGFMGIHKGETHAYNSASLFRVTSLNQIGGFNDYFWLDCLDAWVYRQLYLRGKKVYIAGDIQVEHELSLLRGEKGVTSDRYSNYLKAECAFYDIYEGRIRGLELTLRLLARFCRLLIRRDSSGLRKLNWWGLKRRLLQSKNHRIDEWKKEMEVRTPSFLSTNESTSTWRPNISVCMAAYNGERYITDQLQSILHQLGDGDEVIVVDDASTDKTKDCVRALCDPRIRLIEHKKNQGVSRTFEDAIRNASNNLVFLSDQDDLWETRKVETILRAFRSHPDVTLIATDAALIDSNGAVIRESYFAGRGKFRPGLLANLVQNWFGGCTMAFRAELIPDILPLPHKYHVLHDLWIGVRNSLSGHRSLFINEQLVLNRRHSSTTTGRSSRTTGRKIRARLDLLLALAEFWIRRRGDFAGL